MNCIYPPASTDIRDSYMTAPPPAAYELGGEMFVTVPTFDGLPEPVLVKRPQSLWTKIAIVCAGIVIGALLALLAGCSNAHEIEPDSGWVVVDAGSEDSSTDEDAGWLPPVQAEELTITHYPNDRVPTFSYNITNVNSNGCAPATNDRLSVLRVLTMAFHSASNQSFASCERWQCENTVTGQSLCEGDWSTGAKVLFLDKEYQVGTWKNAPLWEAFVRIVYAHDPKPQPLGYVRWSEAGGTTPTFHGVTGEFVWELHLKPMRVVK